jgi:hypothetical protein
MEVVNSAMRISEYNGAFSAFQEARSYDEENLNDIFFDMYEPHSDLHNEKIKYGKPPIGKESKKVDIVYYLNYGATLFISTKIPIHSRKLMMKEIDSTISAIMDDEEIDYGVFVLNLNTKCAKRFEKKIAFNEILLVTHNNFILSTPNQRHVRMLLRQNEGCYTDSIDDIVWRLVLRRKYN